MLEETSTLNMFGFLGSFLSLRTFKLTVSSENHRNYQAAFQAILAAFFARLTVFLCSVNAKSHVTIMISIIYTAEALTFPVQCTDGPDMDQPYFSRLHVPARESGLRQSTEGRPVRHGRAESNTANKQTHK